MSKIISTKKLGGALAIGALIWVLGCESVALLPRDDVADRSYGERRDDSRRDLDRMARDARRDEIYGTVQEVDERRREIRVRTEDGRSTTISYDAGTKISDGSRELRPDALRSGDEISVRLGRDSGGERYADTIRVEDKRGGWRR